MPGPVVIFDLDGVISDTASLHAKSWKFVFDIVLEQQKSAHTPFSEIEDYEQYVNGKSRQVGIKSFLHSRNIKLDIGNTDDDDLNSIHGIGNRKNKEFKKFISETGVNIFDDAKTLIEALRDNKVMIGIASSSKNAKVVLEKARMLDFFSVILDGLVAEKHGIESKPSPDFYTHAALMHGKQPAQCFVIEDAISGVVSAKAAGIGTVIGVTRTGNRGVLCESGADIVVESLDALTVRDFLTGS